MKRKFVVFLAAVTVFAASFGSVYRAYDLWPEMTEAQKQEYRKQSSDLAEQIEEECKQGLNNNATAMNSVAAGLTDDLHTYGEEYVLKVLIVNYGKNTTSRFGYGWFDQRRIQLYVDGFHCFGSYVSLLREAGFDSVDYTVAIQESLAHGEITQAEADALLRGEMVITQRAAQAIGDSINNDKFTVSIPNCVKMYQSGNFMSASTAASSVKVADYSAVMFTVEGTDVYSASDLTKVVLKDIGAGLPIQVTGITENGFFRVVIAGATYYITGNELVEQKQ